MNKPIHWIRNGQQGASGSSGL